MAEEDAAVATTGPAGQQVINGFERLATTSTPTDNPATVAPVAANPAAANPAAQEPVWPTGSDPEQPVPQPAQRGAPQAALPDPPRTAPANAPEDQVQFDAAWQVLRDALVAQTSGVDLDVQRRAQDEVGRGNGQVMGIALRALAAEGRARAGVDDAAGRALRDAGIAVMTASLDTVADRMAAAAEFVLPDVISPTLDGEGLDAFAPYRTTASELFDLLGAEQVLTALAEVERPPVDLAAGAFPMQVQAQNLRGPRTLQRAVQARMEDLQRAPEQAPAGVPMTLAIAQDALNTLGLDYPVRIAALRAVGADRSPLHTVVRVRQFADLLDRQFPNRPVQQAALGTYEADRNLADHLRAIGAEMERIVANPVAMAQTRAATLFGRLNADTIAATLSAPQPRVAAQAELGADPAPEPQPATAGERSSAASVSRDTTPYSYDPDLLPEHALLGSLLHAPMALDDLEAFLGTRDFSNTDTRAVYATLRGLHRAGALFDVAAMPSEVQRLQAANENHVRLFTALRADPLPYTNHRIANIPRLISQINAAAPAESLPFRGVYDPGAQLRLGRMVLEDSIRRQLAGLGLRMERATPLLAPVQATQRAERSAQALVANLETIESQLDAMSTRMIEAVKRTGPDAAATGDRAEQATSSSRSRWRMPDRFRAITEPLQHRAERHIIHLALHAGRMGDVPAEILNLAPEDFSSDRHANLWRTIQDIQARGEPVNYVAVFRQIHAEGFAHHPVLTDKTLTRMAEPPEIKPDRVARSLRTLVSSALSRARQEGQQAIAAVSTGPTVPAEQAIGQVRKELGGLTRRAKTAVQQHREITSQQMQAQTRNGSR